MRKVDFGERRLHWLRNVTEPVPTYSARERACPGQSLKAAAARRFARGETPTATRLEVA